VYPSTTDQVSAPGFGQPSRPHHASTSMTNTAAARPAGRSEPRYWPLSLVLALGPAGGVRLEFSPTHRCAIGFTVIYFMAAAVSSSAVGKSPSSRASCAISRSRVPQYSSVLWFITGRRSATTTYLSRCPLCPCPYPDCPQKKLRYISDSSTPSRKEKSRRAREPGDSDGEARRSVPFGAAHVLAGILLPKPAFCSDSCR
jgi:hypothetical protein